MSVTCDNVTIDNVTEATLVVAADELDMALEDYIAYALRRYAQQYRAEKRIIKTIQGATPDGVMNSEHRNEREVSKPEKRDRAE